MLGKMGVPSLMRGIVSNSARKQTVGRARTQGIGRAPRADVVASCNRVIDALAEHMGDRPYFCGDKPTTYDATVYAFTAGILCPAFKNEVYKHGTGKKNLVAYTDRIEEQYWKD
jgi:glutathione S-transferase